MDNLTKEQRRKNMQRIRAKDTSIELRLRRHCGIKDIVIGKMTRTCW